jgi:hypothetical protein
VIHEKISKWPPPHLFVIISPLKRTWPLICTILNSLYLWLFLQSLIEIGRLILKKTFKTFRWIFTVLLLFPPYGCPLFVQFWIPFTLFTYGWFVPTLVHFWKYVWSQEPELSFC